MLIVKDLEYCGQEGLFEVMDIFSILIIVVIIWLYTFVNVHRTVHLNK